MSLILEVTASATPPFVVWPLLCLDRQYESSCGLCELENDGAFWGTWKDIEGNETEGCGRTSRGVRSQRKLTRKAHACSLDGVKTQVRLRSSANVFLPKKHTVAYYKI